MRVNANADRCIGAGQCVLIAPEVFDQSDEGTVLLLAETLDDAARAVLWQAVRSCPSRSISLADG